MFIIRADGNAKIGAGHLMRCLTIAEALKESLVRMPWHEEVLFVCAGEDSARLVEEHGFAAKVLYTDYWEMEQELPKWKGMRAELQKKGSSKDKTPCVILIDSYFVTDSYVEQLKQFMEGYFVCLLDDMQEHTYPADGIINYNVYADREVYSRLYQGRDTKLYLGSQYVPVRKQFLHGNYQVAEKVNRVLITTGGGDVDNIAGRILKSLLKHNDKLKYDLIIGRFHPGFEEMRKLAAEVPNVQVHHDVQDMAALMEQCDLAVTAGGSTIYELAAVGVPLICFSYAENQEQLTEYIGRMGIAGFAGAYHKNPEGTLRELVRLVMEFCGDGEKRNKCYLKERQLVDGQGAMRLAKAVLLGL